MYTNESCATIFASERTPQGGLNMTISYKKLWIMLAEREMSKAELRRLAGLSPATLTKLRRNQSVSMEVLMKIAEVMDCNIGDMMDFLKTAEN